jgi:hypothetical protein
MVPKKSNSEGVAKIVQFGDEKKTLPDGSKVIYAESDEKIVLYHKVPFEKGTTFVYERKTGKIYVNGTEGSNQDKRKMLQLGSYMLSNTKNDDLVTVNVFTKPGS